jgi:hypothetical protein
MVQFVRQFFVPVFPCRELLESVLPIFAEVVDGLGLGNGAFGVKGFAGKTNSIMV